MSQVACIGAGLVGGAWAAVFARAGHEVRLFDSDGERLRQETLPAIRRTIESLRPRRRRAPGSTGAAVARITVADSIAEAVDGVVHVQESVREDVDLKRRIATEIAEAAPRDAHHRVLDLRPTRFDLSQGNRRHRNVRSSRTRSTRPRISHWSNCAAPA